NRRPAKVQQSKRVRVRNGCAGGLRRVALPAVAVAVGAQMARADAYFWTNQGSTYNWSEGANWGSDVSPANNGSSDLFFGALPPGGAFFAVADVPGSTTYGAGGFRVGGG